MKRLNPHLHPSLKLRHNPRLNPHLHPRASNCATTSASSHAPTRLHFQPCLIQRLYPRLESRLDPSLESRLIPRLKRV